MKPQHGLLLQQKGLFVNSKEQETMLGIALKAWKKDDSGYFSVYQRPSPSERLQHLCGWPNALHNLARTKAELPATYLWKRGCLE